jgi:hypothetical protein
MLASVKCFEFMFFDTTRMSTEELVGNLGDFAANWTRVYRRQPYETIDAHTDQFAALQQDVMMIDTFPDLSEKTYQLLRLLKPLPPFTALTSKITAALKSVHESDKAQDKLTAKRKRGKVAYGDDLPEDISDGLAEFTGQAFKRLAARLDQLIPQKTPAGGPQPPKQGKKVGNPSLDGIKAGIFKKFPKEDNGERRRAFQRMLQGRCAACKAPLTGGLCKAAGCSKISHPDFLAQIQAATSLADLKP